MNRVLRSLFSLMLIFFRLSIGCDDDFSGDGYDVFRSITVLLGVFKHADSRSACAREVQANYGLSL